MKKFLISALTLFSLVSTPAFAEEETAEALLHQMNEASQQLNYELSYILIKKNSIEPLLYRHARHDQKEFAHLIYLSGPMREVFRRDNEVSYIEPGVDPFTIESGTMVAPVIPMLTSDVDELKQYYDFVKMGRAREAGTACQVIRIVPKDGLRYSYMLWVDEKTHLPLRADLIDRYGEILEQYRSISYSVNEKLAEVMAGFDNIQLPEVLSLPKSKVSKTFWSVGWKPVGFKSININRYRMANTERVVENQMFSDGLFTFSVYVADKDENSLKGQLVRQGRRTVHSYIKGDLEVSIVGDIPPDTAKRIAQSVEFDKDKAKIQ